MKDGFISKLELTCEQWRGKGKRVGLTNGCFDLLHDGHMHLLKEARKYCDFLVVAVNSDESVRKLKGEKRPVENRGIRYKKLLSTRLADMIVGFEDERDLLEIMKEAKPDVLVKGSDYRGMPITGAGYIQKIGSKVVMIPLLQGFSTTSRIEALKPMDSHGKVTDDERR